MSSNRNQMLAPVRAENGFTLNDVMRIASEYKDKRFKVLSDVFHQTSSESGTVGEPLERRVKKMR
ncbi:hypothetical protein SC206_00495 [Rouxiella sp. T17]|uniref:hypothetical protein n=1 Tax=Rouxiella sp. T17 TaxID=3085684 RepID=UPI002FC88A5E